MSSPLGSRDAIVTPEAVPLELDIAGAGSRMVASLIDHLIQSGILIVFGLLIAGLSLLGIGTGVASIIFFVVFFLVFWGYFFFFEAVWNGETPGKRRMRLRVVRANGQPIQWQHALIRNLLRIIDFLPSSYALGVLLVLFTKRSQRIGDLAAGTMVMRERRIPVPAELAFRQGVPDDAHLDTARVSGADYELIRSFLQRRDSLDPEPRRALATKIAARLRPASSGETLYAGNDEAFLEALAQSYRGRFRKEGEVLDGDRGGP